VSITAFAVRNYRFIIVITVAAVLLGVMGFLQMPRQEDPNLSTFGGIITVIYPGASADEIEDRVLEPIEEAAHELEEVDEVQSSASDDVAVIRAEFRDDVDKDEAYDLLVQRVTAVRGDLPAGVTDFDIRTTRPLDVVVFEIAIWGEGAEPSLLEAWGEELEARLRSLPDAGRVRVEASQAEEVHVRVDPARLAETGLALSQVVDLLAAANGDIPGGVVHSGDRRFSVRPNAKFRDLDDVRATVLTAVNGRPVRVEHVAEVSWGYEDPSYLARYNGHPAVLVTITQKEDRNIFDLANDVRGVLAGLQEDLPGGIQAAVAFDQAESVESNLRTFSMSLLQGGLIIVLLVALITGWRSALAVLSALMISVGASFFLLDNAGIALQQMSIAGLVTVLGLLVDNAIVVVEGILRARSAGVSAIKAAIQGTDRVATAVASSTATTVAAFVPMMRTEGSVGEFTRDIPIVVSVVLIVSLGVALLVTPLVAWKLFRTPGSTRPFVVSRWFDRHLTEHLYDRTLGFVVRRPRVIMLLAVVLTVAMLGLTPFIGMSFFPAAEKPLFLVTVEAPRGTSIRATDSRVRDVEAWMMSRPEVVAVTANIGKGNPQIYYNQIREAEAGHLAQLLVTVSREDASRVPALVREVREAFDGRPDFTVKAKQFMQGPPVGLPVSIELTGEDLESLSAHATRIEDALRRIPGAVNVENDLRPGPARLDLRVDPVTAGKLGLNAGVVAREVRYAISGEAATVLRMGDEDYDVVVRVAPEGEEGFADLERVRLPLPGGTPVPLSQLTRPTLAPTYAAINHTDLKRSVIVGADVDGRLAADVLADLLPVVEELKLAPEESWRVIGEDEERDRAFMSMLTNVFVALALIYGILVLQFGSFRQPLVVFTSLPVALTGSALGLMIGGWSFGFTAFIGLLALTGIVVNNAIVLVDRINQHRREGMEIVEAIVVGSKSRLQPILMTTGTTVAGLLPLTLSRSSLWSPMGWVIIGGLMVSTFVTLVLVPAIYLVMTRQEKSTETILARNGGTDRDPDGSRRGLGVTPATSS
jgi:multidrug efflux pump subunit AcrB